MFTPYLASDAKAAADAYYAPLTQIFEYIKTNAKNGMYTVVVGGIEFNASQIDIIQKSGYAIEVVVDEQDKTKYQISWAS
jgi:hypothetical protein